MFGYIKNNSGYGAFTNTKVDFFPEAKDAFEQQKQDLMLAKKFIFLEYFAIEDTKSFHQVEEILLKKIKEGIKEDIKNASPNLLVTHFFICYSAVSFSLNEFSILTISA